MGSKQIFNTSGILHPAVTNAVPSGSVGINFGLSLPEETKKWRKILLAITQSGGASDITLWSRRVGGVPSDTSDDTWGLFQDMFGINKLGKVATALPNGTYHFIIPDVGGFGGLYVQNTAGTTVVVVFPIEETS